MRRGLFEIIAAFILIVVLVFSVIFFLAVNNSSAVLYGKVRKDIDGPRDAVIVKDALLACHRLDYFHEDLFSQPCTAATMQQGYRVTQYELNGCENKTWGNPPAEFTQAIPFVVSVEQELGERCLARLEVFR